MGDINNIRQVISAVEDLQQKVEAVAQWASADQAAVKGALSETSTRLAVVEEKAKQLDALIETNTRLTERTEDAYRQTMKLQEQMAERLKTPPSAT